MSAPGGECFFCGVAADPTQEEGTAFMTVVGSMTGLYGAWPVHISCVAAAKHPEAGEATVHHAEHPDPGTHNASLRRSRLRQCSRMTPGRRHVALLVLQGLR